MKWIFLLLLVLISWVGGRWTVKKHLTNPRKLKQLGRANLLAIALVGIGVYALMKFQDQSFTEEYYLLLIFLFNARLSLAAHQLLLGNSDPNLSPKEKESRMYGSIIVILGIGLMLLWLIIGYSSPGSLGTMPLGGK